ncbi:MAG: hydrogenase maturation nickel metallochaperone HypA [Sphingomonadales bacterium]|nr:hydrogenase maturation nickel metallochaperone HypA [Sphingomonadales bacterium]MBD3772620.1 hydrogenase maturation nickel metallochaperone HypA [Paracoccaceae bacterium]
MHELAICQGLIDEVERIAADNGGGAVDSILLAVGPLSGVEPVLLQRAFEVARAGSCAAQAELAIELLPVMVACRSCGGGGEASANRLLCPQCGDWQVDLVSGDELQIRRVALDCDAPAAG